MEYWYIMLLNDIAMLSVLLALYEELAVKRGYRTALLLAWINFEKTAP